MFDWLRNTPLNWGDDNLLETAHKMTYSIEILIL